MLKSVVKALVREIENGLEAKVGRGRVNGAYILITSPKFELFVSTGKGVCFEIKN
jgi:hypothetical protein